MTAQTLDRTLSSFRIGDPAGTDPIFDATGSTIAPGRWNTPGSPGINTSEHIDGLVEKRAWQRPTAAQPAYIEITILRGLITNLPTRMRGKNRMPRHSIVETWCSDRRTSS